MVKFNGLVPSMKKIFHKHGTKIMTGAGIGGMIFATVNAVKNTPRAMQLIEQAEEEKNGKLTAKEYVKVTWKCYTSSAIAGLASIGLIVGSDVVASKKIADLSGVASILAVAGARADEKFEKYREKVVQEIGPEREKDISNSVETEQTKEAPIEKTIFVSTDRKLPFYDEISGRTFWSTYSDIQRAVNVLNAEMFSGDGTVELNQFYAEVGMPSAEVGNKVWDYNKSGLISFSNLFTRTIDDIPYIVIRFSKKPE